MVKPIRESRRLDWEGMHIREGMLAKARKEPTFSGSVFHKETTTIKCSQCKAERQIYKQDVHQVKLCKDCQRRKRNARPKLKSKGIKHGAVARRRKKRRSNRPEPSIPDFADRSPGAKDDQVIII